MNALQKTPRTIDEYIAGFPEDTQKILEEIRAIIKQNAPDAEESVSYMMPTFKLRSVPLVYFGCFKTHIGFYPMPDSIAVFKNSLAEYKTAKATVRFPLNKPIPFDLIADIVKFRMVSVLEHPKATKKVTKKQR